MLAAALRAQVRASGALKAGWSSGVARAAWLVSAFGAATTRAPTRVTATQCRRWSSTACTR
eukprot:2344894-Pleurochrysis_carterae.AAC.3